MPVRRGPKQTFSAIGQMSKSAQRRFCVLKLSPPLLEQVLLKTPSVKPLVLKLSLPT